MLHQVLNRFVDGSISLSEASQELAHTLAELQKPQTDKTRSSSSAIFQSIREAQVLDTLLIEATIKIYCIEANASERQQFHQSITAIFCQLHRHSIETGSFSASVNSVPTMISLFTEVDTPEGQLEIIKTLGEIDNKSRTSIVRTLIPHLSHIVNGDQIAAILKAASWISQEKRSEAAPEIVHLIKGISDVEQQQYLLAALRKVPKDQRAAAVHFTALLLEGFSIEKERIEILNILRGISVEEFGEWDTFIPNKSQDHAWAYSYAIKNIPAFAQYISR